MPTVRASHQGRLLRQTPAENLTEALALAKGLREDLSLGASWVEIETPHRTKGTRYGTLLVWRRSRKGWTGPETHTLKPASV